VDWQDEGVLFTMLLVGLEKCLRQGKPYPYPVELQYALNRLALGMSNFPKTFAQFLLLLEKPIEEWWCGGELPEAFDSRLSLVYLRELTEVAEDYLLNHQLRGVDVKQLLLHTDNLPFRIFYEELRDAYQHAPTDELDRLEMEYTQVRAFIIRNPFTTPSALRREFGMNWERFAAFYMPVEDHPSVWISSGACWNCPVCGALGLDRNGDPASTKPDVCQSRCPGVESWNRIPVEPHLHVVKPGILRRLVIPGRVELALYEHLQGIQARYSALTALHLYPGIDAYDIRLEFADYQTWAVDVKDYHDPIALGKQLTGSLRQYDADQPLRWNRLIYVVPDDREVHHPGYCERATYESGLETDAIQIVTISAFCRQVEHKAWEME
jgi:hypothetical protein